MEWFNSLFSPFKERLKSQIYSAIFFSWIICNWYILVAIFTDSKYFENDAEKKIQYIKEYFDVCTYWFNLIVLPTLYTLIYIYILPIIDKSIFKYRDKIERQKLKEKHELIESVGYSTNEYLNLHKSYEKAKNEIKSATVNLREKDKDLTKKISQVDELEDNIEKQKKTIDELNSIVKTYTIRDQANEVFLGEWKIEFLQKDNVQSLGTIKVKFDINKIYQIETQSSSNELATIILFDYNPSSLNVKILIKELKVGGNIYNYILLSISNFTPSTQKIKGVLNFLNGNQNIGSEIILERVI